MLKAALTRGSGFKMKLKNLIEILVAFMYLIVPNDLIPDAIPFIGLTDDMSVLKMATKAVLDELERYRSFSLLN